MKKIIGILIAVLFTITVFGQQNLNSRSLIEYRHWSEWSNMSHFYIERHLPNGKLQHRYLYMLAYEPNFERGLTDGMRRKIYLYCVDATPDNLGTFREHYDWIRVSDVILEGYYIDGAMKDYDFHMYNERTQNLSHSSVEVKDNGKTIIFTVDVTEQKGGEDYYTRCYQETVELVIDPERQSFFNYYKLKK